MSRFGTKDPFYAALDQRQIDDRIERVADLPARVLGDKRSDATAVTRNDAEDLARLRAMEQRLIEWAALLDANRDTPGDIGGFIAVGLRRRMAGDK